MRCNPCRVAGAASCDCVEALPNGQAGRASVGVDLDSCLAFRGDPKAADVDQERVVSLTEVGCAQSFNLTSQISGSVGSGLTSKPRCRHISSITVFSLSTSPDMTFSPSDLA